MSIAPTSLVTVALSTYSYSTDDPSASFDVIGAFRPRGEGEGILGCGVEYIFQGYTDSVYESNEPLNARIESVTLTMDLGTHQQCHHYHWCLRVQTNTIIATTTTMVSA